MKKMFPLSGIAAIILSVILVSCNGNNGSKAIGLNQNIHHDDFEYSVTSFERTSSLTEMSDPVISENGNFYLVHFKVQNKALRVSHKWDNTICYIVDGNDIRYENSKEHQILLNKSLNFGWKEQYITQAGNSDSTILVFNLPREVDKPYLMVRGGILMGDVFDNARFRKMKIRLF